jgi:MraZ protein
MHKRVEKWWTVVNNAKTIYIGEFEHSVDAKGRVAVPNAFRRLLPIDGGNRLVLVRGADDCIEVHPSGEWSEHFAQKMERLPLYGEQALRIRRSRLASAREVEIDGQGRVLIPKNLREIAAIDGAAVVLGVGPFFEVWEPGRYRQYLRAAEGHYRNDLNLLDGDVGTTAPHTVEESGIPRAGDGE